MNIAATLRHGCRSQEPSANVLGHSWLQHGVLSYGVLGVPSTYIQETVIHIRRGLKRAHRFLSPIAEVIYAHASYFMPRLLFYAHASHLMPTSPKVRTPPLAAVASRGSQILDLADFGPRPAWSSRI